MGEGLRIDVDRVRQILEENTRKGARFSMRGLSKRAGLQRDTVYDIIRGRNANPTLEVIDSLARALDLDLSTFMLGKGSEAQRLAGEYIEVRGAVQAGVWRESTEWDEDERYQIVVGPSPYPLARRFALKVVGDSMDQVYPEGTLLDCLSMYDLPEEPETGEHVIVERICFDGTRELTVKEFYVAPDGKQWLLARSNNPEFQAPIPAHNGDPKIEETRVCALVIGSYQPTKSFRRRMGPLN